MERDKIYFSLKDQVDIQNSRYREFVELLKPLPQNILDISLKSVIDHMGVKDNDNIKIWLKECFQDNSVNHKEIEKVEFEARIISIFDRIAFLFDRKNALHYGDFIIESFEDKAFFANLGFSKLEMQLIDKMFRVEEDSK